MGKILLAFALVLLSWPLEAQVHKSVSPKAKPSKELTIQYLNEKLNENCVGKGILTSRTMYDIDYQTKIRHLSWCKTQTYYFNSFAIGEVQGNFFIKISINMDDKITSFEKSTNTNESSEMIVKIPVAKIYSINFIDMPDEETGDELMKDRRFAGRFMAFATEGKNVSIYDRSHGKTTQLPGFFIPSLNSADEERMKRAVLNLQSFCKKNR